MSRLAPRVRTTRFNGQERIFIQARSLADARLIQHFHGGKILKGK